MASIAISFHDKKGQFKFQTPSILFELRQMQNNNFVGLHAKDNKIK